jgi:hypothetical protein
MAYNGSARSTEMSLNPSDIFFEAILQHFLHIVVTNRGKPTFCVVEAEYHCHFIPDYP